MSDQVVEGEYSAENLPINWVHPLDREEARVILNKFLPEKLRKDLAVAPRPHLSNFPNHEEIKVADTVKKRREPVVMGGSFGEESGAWVLRTMYEETFATTPEATLGGILSHHTRSVQNGTAVVALLKGLDSNVFKYSTEKFLTILGEFSARGLLSTDQLEETLETIGNLGIPTNVWGKSFFLSGPSKMRALRNPEILLTGMYKLNMEAGWLFLRASAAYQKELKKVCQDEVLIEEFNLPKGLTKSEVLCLAWRELGKDEGPVFESNGTFRHLQDEGYSEGLKKLAVLRSSPDLAFLYEYFSALSAIQSVFPDNTSDNWTMTIWSNELVEKPSRMLEEYTSALKIPESSIIQHGRLSAEYPLVVIKEDVLKNLVLYADIYSKDLPNDEGVEMNANLIGRVFTYRGQKLFEITDMVMDWQAERQRHLGRISGEGRMEASQRARSLNAQMPVAGFSHYEDIGLMHSHTELFPFYSEADKGHFGYRLVNNSLKEEGNVHIIFAPEQGINSIPVPGSDWQMSIHLITEDKKIDNLSGFYLIKSS